MIDKVAASIAQALHDTPDGATVMIGGFGTAGIPNELVAGLIDQGARDLTVVNNNAGNGDEGLAALLKTGRVCKIICSFPRQADEAGLKLIDTVDGLSHIELQQLIGLPIAP